MKKLLFTIAVVCIAFVIVGGVNSNYRQQTELSTADDFPEYKVINKLILNNQYRLVLQNVKLNLVGKEVLQIQDIRVSKAEYFSTRIGD